VYLRRVLLWPLVLALLVAQTLGLLHAVVHSPVHAGVQQVELAGHDHPAHGHGLIDTLFATHGGGADCRLYDQLSHGDVAAAVPVVVLPLLLPATLFAYFQGEAVARHAALFEARAPPSIR
jgi:hypothetical protein